MANKLDLSRVQDFDNLPPTLRRHEVSHVGGWSDQTTDRLISQGAVESVRVGSTVLVKTPSLRKVLAQGVPKVHENAPRPRKAAKPKATKAKKRPRDRSEPRATA